MRIDKWKWHLTSTGDVSGDLVREMLRDWQHDIAFFKAEVDILKEQLEALHDMIQAVQERQ